MKRLPTIACLLLATSAYAQPPMVYIGAGSNSCGKWSTVQKATDTAEKDKLLSTDTYAKDTMLAFVQGYLFGQAMMAQDTLHKAIAKERHVAWEAVPFDDVQRIARTASGGWFDVPDRDALVGWLTSYCSEHPLARIHAAAEVLTNELTRANFAAK